MLVSIHDVSPRFEVEIDQLLELLAARLGGPNLAMLVVPDHWNSAPIAADKSFQAKLRGWSDMGIEMFVHGWSHRDESAHDAAIASFKAKHMTAGEGEFLGLAYDRALPRMIDGKKLVEDIIGKPSVGFIAPAWLYGDGALQALNEAGFTIAEDHMKVWNPQTGERLTRGPVITWASRSKARITSSLAFAALARNALRPTRNVRLAVHPGDAHVPALLGSISQTLTSLLPGRAISRYADLQAPGHAAV